jgi:biopolymer transport protein ExbB/TolQ
MEGPIQRTLWTSHPPFPWVWIGIIVVVAFSLWTIVKAFRARSNPQEVMRILGFFGVMAPIAVLLGLAGAVGKMMWTCNKIAAMGGNHNAADIADALSFALWPVYAGLLIAAFVIGMKALLTYWLLPSRSEETE